ncbi:MAG: hypothetical protein V3R83_09830 [Gammaproteobacteria bacterium]
METRQKHKENIDDLKELLFIEAVVCEVKRPENAERTMFEIVELLLDQKASR